MALDIEKPSAAFALRAGKLRNRSHRKWLQIILNVKLLNIEDTVVDEHDFLSIQEESGMFAI